MINALAGQTLYATVTIRREAQTHEVDVRLSEALALAVRLGARLFITRSLLATVATLDLTTQASASSWEELEGRGKDLVIFAEKPARDLSEETHQSIRQIRQELSNILTQ